MTVSAIIPTCDRNEFLAEAISSILRQSLPPDKIIIVNNGKEKIALPKEIVDNIEVIDIEPYSGAARARNAGAKRSSENYLAFLDDDDLWHPDYLRKVAAAVSRGARCVISRLDLLDKGEIRPYKNASGKLTIDNLLVYNPGITGSNIVVARGLFMKLGGFDEQLVTSEDKSLAIEIIRTGEQIAILSDNQAIHRIGRAGQNLDSNAKKMAAGIGQFTRKYSAMMSRKQLLKNWQKIYRYRYAAGQSMALLPLAMLYLLNKIINLGGTTNRF